MNFEEKNEPKYSYNFYQHDANIQIAATAPIGKLPKIKMTLPKIKIKENLELKFAN